MWKIIAERELRDQLQSTRFLVAAGVTMVLLLFSIGLGIYQYKSRVAQYEQAVQMSLDLAAQQANWYSVQATAWRTPDPMEIFSNGINSDIGRYANVGRGTVRLVRSEFSDDPMLAVFQLFDPTFVVLIVLSLLAILFTYNAVNGEKEGGTLKLLFANKISRSDFILGKLLGSCFSILTPVLIAFLIGILFIIFAGVEMSGALWGRLALFILATFLYTTCFLLIGVFVSTLTHRSSVSFLILLVVWVTASLIIPKAATMLAGQAVPVQSADEIESKITSYTAQARNENMNQMMKYYREQERSVEGMKPTERQQFFRDNQAKLMKEMDDRRKAMEDDIASYSQRLYEDYYNQKNNQAMVAFSMSKFSPASQFQLAAMKLAGTDLQLKKRYDDAMKQYNTQYTNFIQQKGGRYGIRIGVTSSGGRTSASMTGPEESKINVSEMPRFQSPVYSFGEAFEASMFDLGLLGLCVILGFVASFVSFLRFDMR
ncbi:MAG: ABC transporter permease subunit [bacterium]